MVAMRLFYTALFSFLSQLWEAEYGVLTAKKVNLTLTFSIRTQYKYEYKDTIKVSFLYPSAQQFLHITKRLQMLLYAVRIRQDFL